jgi:hypothetical protein
VRKAAMKEVNKLVAGDRGDMWWSKCQWLHSNGVTQRGLGKTQVICMHNEKPLGDRQNYEPGPEEEGWLSFTLQQLKSGLDTRSSAMASKPAQLVMFPSRRVHSCEGESIHGDNAVCGSRGA